MKSLTRYWIEFEWPRHEGVAVGLLQPFGFGATAYDVDDALALLQTEFFEATETPIPPIRTVIENVDLSTLDEHARPNMHPPNWRGVWYPMLKTLR